MNGRVLQRLPYTLILALGVIIAGILTGAPWKAVDPGVIQHWGFALDDLREGRWFTLLTGVLITRGPLMFWGIVVFAFASVGGLEWQIGPRRAVVRYWQTELVGSIGGPLVLQVALASTHSPLAASFPHIAEVGMSAGGFGCLGAALACLTARTRQVGFWGVTVYLVVRLVFFTELASDTVHLITFPLGYWLESRTR